MHQIKIAAVSALAVLALSAAAFSPAAAQARAGASHAGPAVVHKGVSVYQWCTEKNGCWTALFVYAKTKEFEAPETQIYGGSYATKKISKKNYTVFTSDLENGAQCVMTALKNSKGYGSASAPGTIVCEEGGVPYIEEAWWAVRV